MTNCTGSAAWMAPEVFEGNVYIRKSHIFCSITVLLAIQETTIRKNVMYTGRISLLAMSLKPFLIACL